MAALGGSVWVGSGVVVRERWPIRWLELNGAFQRISAEQLRASLTPLIHTSIFTLDLERLQDAVLRNPWVASVTIQKRWPDTVAVTVREHRPLAHWNDALLVSDRGVLFAPPDADEIQGLPWLRGPADRSPAVLEHWTRFNAMLDSVGLEIRELVLDARGAWSMETDIGTRLELGRDDPVARLERFTASWRVLMAGRQAPPVRVDLRYANGFAVQWPGEAAELAGAEH